MNRAIVVLLLLVAGVAHADDDTTARKAAEAHFRSGEKAYAAQNFGAAATNFELAYRELKLPEIAFAVAQSYRRWYRIEPTLERAKKAVDHYDIYIKARKTGGAKLGVAIDAHADMQKEVDKLTAAGAKVVAQATVEKTQLGITPVNAAEAKKTSEATAELGELPAEQVVAWKIWIDDKPVEPYVLIDVDPGPHKVRIEAPGFITTAVTKIVAKGEERNHEVPVEPQPAKVTVTAERGARIQVDGRAVPGTTFDVPAGKHLITVKRLGRETVSREIEVGRGQSLAFAQPLQKTGRRKALPYVVGAGLATGVLAILGTTVMVASNSAANDHLAAIRRGDQEPQVLADYNDAIRTRDDARTGVLITGGLTLGLAGAAAVMYWFDRPEGEGFRMAPLTGGTTTGMAIGGRF